MPRLQHRTLSWITLGTAFLGQLLMDSNPKAGIIVCGIALAAALVDGWWYLIPLRQYWWFPAMLAIFGITMTDGPTGWFFIAWALIQVGTGLRAQVIVRQFHQAVAAEKARQQRIAAGEYDAVAEQEAAAMLAATGPLPLWRYVVAVLVGLAVAILGAWGIRLFFDFTHLQLDALALVVGFVVGKSVAMTASNRSTPALQGAAAILTGWAVLYGRYLILKEAFFEQRDLPSTVGQVVRVAFANPADRLGWWLLFFLVLAIYVGWRSARTQE
ncbi:MAG: hypothetical protein ACM3XM_13295 [Mycobacterium leprae]